MFIRTKQVQQRKYYNGCSLLCVCVCVCACLFVCFSSLDSVFSIYTQEKKKDDEKEKSQNKEEEEYEDVTQ
jgi:hypothetical protein